MDGRLLDKRKARDKETDSETSDTSINKNPMKRARVEYSPKEKSPSPASAPMGGKVSSLTDAFAAATAPSSASNLTSPTQNNSKAGSNSNGDVSLEEAESPTTTGTGVGAGQTEKKTKVNNINNDSNASPQQSPPVISKFDLPSPFTTQELEQKMGKGKVGDKAEDSDDSDNGSTKFLSDIIQNEEKKKRQGSNKGSNSSSDGNGRGGDGVRSNGTLMTTTPISAMKRSTTATSTNTNRASANNGSSNSNNSSGSGRVGHHPIITSSPVSDLVKKNSELRVTIKIVDPNTHSVLLEETVIRSDTERVDSFLRQHNLKLLESSQGSGYLGDISSEASSSMKSSSSSSRWTMSSLGSTIPRQSIVSIVTDKSDSPEELMKRPGKAPPVSKARKKSDGPIMSSTKIDSDTSSRSSMERMNVSSNPLSNGDDKDKSSSTSSSGKSHQSSSSPPKKLKNAPKLGDIDEGIGASPASNPSPRKGTKSTPKASSSAGVLSSSTAKKPVQRRRGGSANNFPITNTQPPPGLSAVLSTPPPARSVARIEGTQAKPLSRFEQEMNNEPVIESELQKSETLWSTILPSELVFARWRDKNYYSGMVQSKGLNDTWLIDFDDGMQDVASESHIIPVRILGVGVNGIHSPDDHFEPKNAVIIGQKFLIDPDVGGTAVKYAIKRDGDDTPIWCSRRQLSIKESDAKKLRPEYASITPVKAGDVSTDNIVSGPRRRTRGESTPSAPPSTEPKRQRQVVAGAFDGSSADDKLLDSSTPKSRVSAKGVKKTPATPANKTKGSSNASTSTVLIKDASTSSPTKETPGEESPTRISKGPVIEFGKKRPRKTLFQGLQFLLTAAGGGDPEISGIPVVPPIPYDKEEYRELIESCGGEILEGVGDGNQLYQNKDKENVFLISDSYARTVKYIFCLAAGIPCVSHCWIQQCVDNLEIVDWKIFTLPAGWSLEHQDVIPHHKKKPLKGCKVFVTSDSDQLYNYWLPVLIAAEAVTLKPPRKKGTYVPAGTEVVVTDHSQNTREIVLEADKLKVAVVKPEWLVQTIISGEKAHMYGHDKYKICFNEEDCTEISEEHEGESSMDVEGDDQENEQIENESMQTSG